MEKLTYEALVARRPDFPDVVRDFVHYLFEIGRQRCPLYPGYTLRENRTCAELEPLSWLVLRAVKARYNEPVSSGEHRELAIHVRHVMLAMPVVRNRIVWHENKNMVLLPGIDAQKPPLDLMELFLTRRKLRALLA